MDQPAGGEALAGVQQLVGGVQAGAEQLETTQEDGHDVSSEHENINFSNSAISPGKFLSPRTSFSNKTQKES